MNTKKKKKKMKDVLQFCVKEEICASKPRDGAFSFLFSIKMPKKVFFIELTKKGGVF
jgi:hypothetical protein